MQDIATSIEVVNAKVKSYSKLNIIRKLFLLIIYLHNKEQ